MVFQKELSDLRALKNALRAESVPNHSCRTETLVYLNKMAAILLLNRRLHRNRQFRPRRTINDIGERELGEYRLPREDILAISEAYSRSHFNNITRRGHAIPAETQILAALRFYAKGGHLSETAHIHGLSKASMSRILDKTSKFLASTAPQHIKMPVERQELIQCARDFFAVSQLPGVVGSIDGTHIRIMAPSEEEWAYINRKGEHSINVQIISDATLTIRNVVARWPGSTHDAFMLDASQVKADLEAGRHHGYWLLGDSGYPCRKYLITPLLNPSNRPEHRFNMAHKRTRSTVERCIGVLKSRFRCLHKTGGILQLKPAVCCQVIMACAVLHNICIAAQVPMPVEYLNNDDIDDDNDYNVNDIVQNAQDGVNLRQTIVQRFN